MICGKCGREVPDGVAFCPSCGAPVEKKTFCGKCGAEIAPGQGFCAACGTPVNQPVGGPANSANAAGMPASQPPQANAGYAPMPQQGYVPGYAPVPQQGAYAAGYPSALQQIAPLLSLKIRCFKNFGPASLYWLCSFGYPVRWKMDFYPDRIEMNCLFSTRTIRYADIAQIKFTHFVFWPRIVITLNDGTMYILQNMTIFHIGRARQAYDKIAPYFPNEKKG